MIPVTGGVLGGVSCTACPRSQWATFAARSPTDDHHRTQPRRPHSFRSGTRPRSPRGRTRRRRIGDVGEPRDRRGDRGGGHDGRGGLRRRGRAGDGRAAALASAPRAQAGRDRPSPRHGLSGEVRAAGRTGLPRDGQDPTRGDRRGAGVHRHRRLRGRPLPTTVRPHHAERAARPPHVRAASSPPSTSRWRSGRGMPCSRRSAATPWCGSRAC